MALPTTPKHYWPFALAVFYTYSFFVLPYGRAENNYPPSTASTAAAGVLSNEYLPGVGGGGGGGGQQVGTNQDYPQPAGYERSNPDHIVAQALLCFNEKQIYSSCNEEYRLSVKGELDVPPEHTDQFCGGPCLSETNLVLNCIEGIFYHFEFYNKATIGDVRETIESGCGYGPHRGDFNVAEHVQNDYGNAYKTNNPTDIIVLILLFGLGLVIMPPRLLL
ncbi:OLC1v1020655C1 [Oldenlandia corymbosa var. corymbosa]|uniref:OLC1v1020655C1 n=1 Tax=Oldenlandia corymbosa var. corymbosa TaxID=529605 RepID=A0AAV1EH21_OLDCO|nr:OLC1v1020655C1 [Oldenlandia corymbosa var. corymbosa]